MTNKTPSENAEDKKAKIRARYQGKKQGVVTCIPANPRDNPFDDTKEKRVAVYIRVSTDDAQQTSSFELQKLHYIEYVESHKNWKLFKMYCDEGISGTSRKKRNAFNEMIADCKAGKIDMIVVKSVSRFSRNDKDFNECLQELASLRPPVGVFFEMENKYSLDSENNMILKFHSMMAEHESEVKSNLMNDSVEKRFRNEIYLTPPLLGYDLDDDGNLVVNQEEAKTVRLAFLMYLDGQTSGQIAETFARLGRKTKKENVEWSSNSVLGILQNERHCGNIVARKTWTPSFLDHKSRKNRQDRNQYIAEDHHEGIVSRDDFNAVKKMINNAKFRNKDASPDLMVVPDGLLKGFVSIHPRWGDFTFSDYQAASASVGGDVAQSVVAPFKIEAQVGDIDLRGFQVVREELFTSSAKPCAMFSIKDVGFNSGCVKKLNGAVFVEMLFHPEKRLLAVRPCAEEFSNAVKWVKEKEGRFCPRSISGKAFLNVLFEMCGWDTKSKYRAHGMFRRHDNQSAIIFSLREVVSINKRMPVFPTEWEETFGVDLYRHIQERELASTALVGLRDIAAKGIPYNSSDKLNTTSAKEISREIKNLIRDMEQRKKRL
jgi:DNA invertase Pin-like site-specific DNA recombinase